MLVSVLTVLRPLTQSKQLGQKFINFCSQVKILLIPAHLLPSRKSRTEILFGWTVSEHLGETLHLEVFDIREGSIRGYVREQWIGWIVIGRNVMYPFAHMGYLIVTV